MYVNILCDFRRLAFKQDFYFGQVTWRQKAAPCFVVILLQIGLCFK